MASNTSSSVAPESLHLFPLQDLRTCFYALLPQETYFESVDDVPPFVFRAFRPWGLALIILEIISLRIFHKSNEWRLHSAVVSYSSTAMYEAFAIFIFRDVELKFYQWTYDNFRLITLPWDAFTTFMVTLLCMEFGAYWWHRMSHEVAVMWASHELHHSSDDFNLSIAFRNSATIRFFRWIFYLPLAFAGVPTSIMLTHFSLGTVYNAVIHHNAVPKFASFIPVLGRVIDFVFVTPSHHRVHHASNKYCIDKNYGQYTILWDRLFGTFAEEREDEILVFGTLTQPRSFDMGSLQFSSYVKLWQKVKMMETLGDKMKALFYGPGWFPGTPRLGNPEDIPDIQGREKYDPKFPLFISAYLVINSLSIFYSYVDMSGRLEDSSTLPPILNLVYIYSAYTAIGGLYDNKPFASRIELIRIVAFLGLSNVLPMLTPGSLVFYLVTGNLYLNLALWPFIFSYNNQKKES